MVTTEIVQACYRAILGRDPESDLVVAEKLDQYDSIEALIREFLASEEFQGISRNPVGSGYFRKPHRVDVQVGPMELGELFARTQKQWGHLGQVEPFWSVLTHEEFRMDKIDGASLERFFASSEQDAGLINLFCERNDVSIQRGVCLEFGCGVGRMTRHLAARFDRVIGVDISEGNLTQCRNMLIENHIENVELILLKKAQDINKIGHFDVLFSVMVLQHNPPPVQAFQLEGLLGKIGAGGGFLFQTQTSLPGYSFDLSAYLGSPIDVMDMHCLPMRYIYDIIRKCGLRLCEVAADHWTGSPGSYTFFGTANELGAKL